MSFIVTSKMQYFIELMSLQTLWRGLLVLKIKLIWPVTRFHRHSEQYKKKKTNKNYSAALLCQVSMNDFDNLLAKDVERKNLVLSRGSMRA